MSNCLTYYAAAFALSATIVGAAPSDSGGSPNGAQGICVRLGCEDTQSLVDLLKQDQFLVHALGYDQESVEKARQRIQDEGRYGQGSSVRLTGKTLPYADHLINRFVVEDYKKATAHGITLADMLRVTCPGGVISIRGIDSASLVNELESLGVSSLDLGTDRIQFTKPRPKEMGDWSHAKQGPDANPVSSDTLVGPPTSLRWLGGPGWPRAGKSNSLFQTLSAEGVNLYFTNGDSNESEIEKRVSILARDAYNGVKLWERHWTATRDYGNGNYHALLHIMAVHNGRLFATIEGNIAALDLRTGKTIKILETAYPTRVTALDNTVVFTLADRVIAYDATTFKPLWNGAGTCYDTVAGDGELFYLQATGEVFESFDLVCRNLRSGQEKWRSQTAKIYNRENNGSLDLPIKMAARRGLLLSLYKDRHVCVSTRNPGGLHVYSAVDGKHIWSRWEGLLDKPVPDRRGKLVHWHELAGGWNAYYVDGLLWTAAKIHKSKENTIRKGYDLGTGELKRELSSIGGPSPSCKPHVLTENYYLIFRKKVSNPGVTFENVRTGESAAPVFNGRLACSVAGMPANGLLYMHPFSCNCVGMPIKGYHALDSRQLVEKPDPPGERFEKGSAFGTTGKVQSFDQDWPIYRGDAQRTASTTTDIPSDFQALWTADFAQDASANLKEDWDSNLYVSGSLTAPVIAGDQVFVALPDQHSVVCLNKEAGKEQWCFTAGARVDSAPTIYQGRCYFGSSDGWVYCLNAENGKLIWRVRLAPKERWIVAYGQLVSAWPVHGSVLVDDGKIRALAGQHRSVDGGLIEFTIDPDNGRVLSKTLSKSSHPRLLTAESPYPYAGTPTYGYLDYSWTRYATAVGRGGGSHVVKSGGRGAAGRGIGGKMTIGNAEQGFVTFDLPKKMISTMLRADGKIKWETPIESPNQVEAMLLTKSHVFTAGTTNRNWRDRVPAFLRVYEVSNGKQSRELTLTAPPIYDGLAAAAGRIYLATVDGKLTCYGQD